MGALLEQAGISKAPGTWDELVKAALAVNKPPERYGFGTMGLQGAGLYSGYAPFLYSNGGRLLQTIAELSEWRSCRLTCQLRRAPAPR